MVVHTYNLSTLEAEEERSKVWGQTGLHSDSQDFEASETVSKQTNKKLLKKNTKQNISESHPTVYFMKYT